LRRRIFVTYILVVSISLLVTGFMTINVSERHLQDALESKLVTNAQAIKRIVAYEISMNSDQGRFEDLALALSRDIGARVTIIDVDGRVLGDSNLDAKDLENHLERSEVKQALRGDIGKSLRYSTTLRSKMIYVAAPIKIDDSIVGVVRLSLPLSEMNRFTQFFWKAMFYAALVGLAAAGFMSAYLSRKVSNPIQEVALAAGQIAQGNYDMRIHSDGPEEMKLLAEAFNHMAHHLDATIKQLTDRKNKIEVILSSMVDGLIAVDHQCHVTMLNPSAEKIFDFSDKNAKQRHLLELIRNQDLYSAIDDVLKKKHVTIREIRLFAPEEKILLVHTAPMMGDDEWGAVALVRDITELRNLEKVRTEFTANVSHELKTPLTLIAGFVETLMDGAYEDEGTSLRFLGIIQRETLRMTRLIDELLYFSNIESRRNPTVKTPVAVRPTAEKVLNLLQTSIAEKDHQVLVNIPEDIAPVMAEEDGLVQILLNLLDNAVKYTPSGGKINIDAWEENDYVYIAIEDSGVGIPEEGISRIFERFYRMDKARSGDIPGTGLGLSVVKHLVQTFEGEISVSSKIGQGTRFTIKLPRA
jgi:two-component system phosphate regulon sensor histidine kinase PhoR